MMTLDRWGLAARVANSGRCAMAIECWALRPSRITSTSSPCPRSCRVNHSAISGWRGRIASTVAGVFALAVSLCAWSQGVADGDDFRVTLLGTGSPQPATNRFGPGVLVQAGGQTLLIDCGRGTTQRLISPALSWELSTSSSSPTCIRIMSWVSPICGSPAGWKFPPRSAKEHSKYSGRQEPAT